MKMFMYRIIVIISVMAHAWGMETPAEKPVQTPVEQNFLSHDTSVPLPSFPAPDLPSFPLPGTVDAKAEHELSSRIIVADSAKTQQMDDSSASAAAGIDANSSSNNTGPSSQPALGSLDLTKQQIELLETSFNGFDGNTGGVGQPAQASSSSADQQSEALKKALSGFGDTDFAAQEKTIGSLLSSASANNADDGLIWVGTPAERATLAMFFNSPEGANLAKTVDLPAPAGNAENSFAPLPVPELPKPIDSASSASSAPVRGRGLGKGKEWPSIFNAEARVSAAKALSRARVEERKINAKKTQNEKFCTVEGCGHKAVDKKGLEKHTRICHYAGDDGISCAFPGCPVVCKTKRSLGQHRAYAHGGQGRDQNEKSSKTSVKCTAQGCGRTCANARSLEIHTDACHYEGPGGTSCPDCSVVCKTKAGFGRHRASAHNDGSVMADVSARGQGKSHEISNAKGTISETDASGEEEESSTPTTAASASGSGSGAGKRHDILDTLGSISDLARDSEEESLDTSASASSESASDSESDSDQDSVVSSATSRASDSDGSGSVASQQLAVNAALGKSSTLKSKQPAGNEASANQNAPKVSQESSNKSVDKTAVSASASTTLASVAAASGSSSQDVVQQPVAKKTAKQVHDGDGNKERCDYCTTVCKDKQGLSVHMGKYHPKEAAQRFNCEKGCGYRASKVCHLTRHYTLAHYEGPNKVNCPDCATSFASVSSMQAHERIVHGKKTANKSVDQTAVSARASGSSSQRVAQQPVPKKAASKPDEDDEQEVRDTSNSQAPKVYHCKEKECNYTYASYNGLWLHRKNAHYAGEGARKCPYCPTSYRTEQGLSKHMSQIHAIRAKGHKQRELVCEKKGCAYTTNEIRNLKQHYKQSHYSGDDAVSCTIKGCTVSCKNELGMKTHMRMQHKASSTTGSALETVRDTSASSSNPLKRKQPNSNHAVVQKPMQSGTTSNAKQVDEDEAVVAMSGKAQPSAAKKSKPNATFAKAAAISNVKETARASASASGSIGYDAGISSLLARHDSEAKISCHVGKCPELFADGDTMLEHFDKYHGPGSRSQYYQCSMCATGYPKQEGDGFTTHMAKHLAKINTTNSCASSSASGSGSAGIGQLAASTVLGVSPRLKRKQSVSSATSVPQSTASSKQKASNGPAGQRAVASASSSSALQADQAPSGTKKVKIDSGKGVATQLAAATVLKAI